YLRNEKGEEIILVDVNVSPGVRIEGLSRKEGVVSIMESERLGAGELTYEGFKELINERLTVYLQPFTRRALETKINEFDSEIEGYENIYFIWDITDAPQRYVSMQNYMNRYLAEKEYEALSDRVLGKKSAAPRLEIVLAMEGYESDIVKHRQYYEKIISDTIQTLSGVIPAEVMTLFEELVRDERVDDEFFEAVYYFRSYPGISGIIEKFHRDIGSGNYDTAAKLWRAYQLAQTGQMIDGLGLSARTGAGTGISIDIVDVPADRRPGTRPEFVFYQVTPNRKERVFTQSRLKEIEQLLAEIRVNPELEKYLQENLGDHREEIIGILKTGKLEGRTIVSPRGVIKLKPLKGTGTLYHTTSSSPLDLLNFTVNSYRLEAGKKREADQHLPQGIISALPELPEEMPEWLPVSMEGKYSSWRGKYNVMRERHSQWVQRHPVLAAASENVFFQGAVMGVPALVAAVLGAAIPVMLPILLGTGAISTLIFRKWHGSVYYDIHAPPVNLDELKETDPAAYRRAHLALLGLSAAMSFSMGVLSLIPGIGLLLGLGASTAGHLFYNEVLVPALNRAGISLPLAVAKPKKLTAAPPFRNDWNFLLNLLDPADAAERQALLDFLSELKRYAAFDKDHPFNKAFRLLGDNRHRTAAGWKKLGATISRELSSLPSFVFYKNLKANSDRLAARGFVYGNVKIYNYEDRENKTHKLNLKPLLSEAISSAETSLNLSAGDWQIKLSQIHIVTRFPEGLENSEPVLCTA
ncbi:MAG TPA: hypothetical protein VJC03_00735, partial [bacterium]|nr:hypothetical protein [bacterium]